MEWNASELERARPSGHQAHCGGALRAQRLSWPANPRPQETRTSVFLVSAFVLRALAENFSGLGPFTSAQKSKNQRMHLLKFHGQMCLLVQNALHSTVELELACRSKLSLSAHSMQSLCTKNTHNGHDGHGVHWGSTGWFDDFLLSV